MQKLEWNRPQDQSYESGLDRGVIYMDSGNPVAWSGLVSVEDGGETTLKEYYIDGIKYLAMVSPRDWKGTLTAITYPDEFGEVIGLGELGDGLYVDSQAPSRFDLSYRTMVTTPAIDTKQHYKIHLLYKVMASLSPFTNQSLTGETVDIEGFEFDLTAVPVKIPGFRPSAHIIIDSRKIDDVNMAKLEDIIYGDGVNTPSMPTPEQLIDLLKYSGDVVVVDNGDGTWTATGSNADIYPIDERGGFEIDHVAAEYLSDEIYLFYGSGPGAATLSLNADTDGVTYYQLSAGLANVRLDTDGVPYFELGAEEARISFDEDGVPYFFT